MSEELKASVRQLVDEAWNKGNLDALDEAYAADFVQHPPPFPDIVGLEAFKQSIANTRSVYSDIQLTIDEIIIEGDTIATRWTWQGTHTGQSPTLPIPPTGKRVINTGVSVVHTVDGKAVEEWSYGDSLGLFQQLGVVPPIGEGGG